MSTRVPSLAPVPRVDVMLPVSANGGLVVRPAPRPRSKRRQQTPRVSVVLPVYNEEETVTRVVEEVIAALNALEERFEVLLVDDGSVDGSAGTLLELRRRYPRHIRVITHRNNKGMGAALKSGIACSRSEFVALMDSDGQHRASDLVRLLEAAQGYDLVIGVRPGNEGAFHRNLANRFFNAFASWLTRTRIEDLTSGFRVFRRASVVRYVHMFPNGYSAATTSTLALLRGGHDVAFVPIRPRPRAAGKSSIRAVRDGWRFLHIIVKIIAIFDPMRVFLPVAGLLAAAALASTVQASLAQSHVHIPNSGVVLGIVSVLVVLLGLVSEQIAALQTAIGELRRQ